MSSEKFTFFWGGVFSQWHPCNFEVDGERFVTAEQFMMAKKADTFGDPTTREKIMATSDPKSQKKLGKQVANFRDEIWIAVARDLVYLGNSAKFRQNPDLLKTLLDTAGSTLVEASPYDRRWGIGLSASNPKALDRTTWRGTNWLGEILTRLRDDILAENGR